jgi:hypothetical protein
MTTNDNQSGPPSGGAAQAAPARSRIHWPTVLFGALPATYLSFPAAVGILVGFFLMGGGWVSVAVFFAGLFGWTGMISLWIAARSGPTIGKRAAVGLVLGLIGAILYAGLYWSNDDLSDRVRLFPPILLAGAIWIALMHLNRFRKLMGTGAAAPSIRAPGPPPSETSTRRVELTLKVLLFGQVLTCCLFGATMLSGSAGLGGLMIIVLAFPLALGAASFAVWAFFRHRPCRPWAAVVFFAPIILFTLLQFGVKFFGQPAITTACGRVAPWLPLAAILLFPRVAGRLIPRLLRQRGACITYVVIQGLMVLPWLLLVLGWRPWTEPGSPAITLFVLWHTGLSILAGVTGLVFSYMGLFRQREERFIGLSIAHMALSILLLAVALPTAWLLMIFMTPMG